MVRGKGRQSIRDRDVRQRQEQSIRDSLDRDRNRKQVQHKHTNNEMEEPAQPAAMVFACSCWRVVIEATHERPGSGLAVSRWVRMCECEGLKVPICVFCLVSST